MLRTATRTAAGSPCERGLWPEPRPQRKRPRPRCGRLGRIPRSDEGYALPLAEAAELARAAGKRFFLEMFSHRWCSRGQPDDDENSKAKALVQWAKYRWATGLASFFWIDYTCIDQENVSLGVIMLPLYVASCNSLVKMAALVLATTVSSDLHLKAWGCPLHWGGAAQPLGFRTEALAPAQGRAQAADFRCVWTLQVQQRAVLRADRV